MGAWGHGILQNDTAQDGLAEVIDSVEADVAALAGRRPGEATAARLGAAVGLLLQLSSWRSFEPGNEVSSVVARAIERQGPAFASLPPRAGRLLRAVGAGKGQDLAARPGRLSPTLCRALFAHPKAGVYVQQVAARCAARAAEDFADEEIASDLAREGEGMGAFATLLVIEPCNVPVWRIEWWRSGAPRLCQRAERDLLPETWSSRYESLTPRQGQGDSR